MMMVRKSKGLSERHIRVLEFLAKYQSENGRPLLSVKLAMPPRFHLPRL